MRLAEALERCSQAGPPEWDEQLLGGGPPPNRLRTAICCQILGELAELAGPLSNVLTSLRAELVRSCYSGYLAPEFGAPLRGGAGARHKQPGQLGGGDAAGADAAAKGAAREVRSTLAGLQLGPGGGAGGGLVFEQLPWHSVAARLRREADALREEQGRVRRELGEHQVRRRPCV